MIKACVIAKKLKEEFGFIDIDLALVLGTGLKDACPILENRIEIKYEMLGMDQSKVTSHSGSFIYGRFAGKNILCASRIHYYEHGDIEKVRLPFEVMYNLGIKTIILASSSGGIRDDLNSGDLMLITDHINFTGLNPLIAMEKIKFFDVSNLYNFDLRTKVLKYAAQKNIKLKTGIHVQTSGPSFETPAEVRLFKSFGGDSVSMSTVFDALICGNYGINVIAFAAISNKAAGLSDEIITHEINVENSRRVSLKLKTIITEFIFNLNNLGDSNLF